MIVSVREMMGGVHRRDWSEFYRADKLRVSTQAMACALLGRDSGLRGVNLFEATLADLDIAWDAEDPVGGGFLALVFAWSQGR